MNILFYLEPWIDHGQPAWRDSWIEGRMGPFIQAVQQFEKTQNCFFLYGDAQKNVAEPYCSSKNMRSAVIHQKELRAIFPDYLSAALAWYRESHNPAQMHAMKSLIKDKLKDFEPDVILTLFTPVPYLRELYPHALILNGDNACFSREPFGMYLTLDPCGVLKDGYIGRHAKDLARAPLSLESKNFLEAFRKKFRDDFLIKRNPFKKDDLVEGKKFKHLVLLPLHISRTFAFNGNCAHATPWDLLCDTLDKTPEDIGVVVTQHGEYERVITPEVDAYLKRTYPNYIFHENFDAHRGSSQYLLQHVDAVAAVSTSLCFQAMLWEKPVCALGSCHINSFAEAENIQDLSQILDQGHRMSKDSLFFFLLSRFNIPASYVHAFHPVWLEKHMSRWLSHYQKHGADLDFFALIDDLNPLLSYHFSAARV